MTQIRGRAHRFGDDVNTDVIIAAQHKAASLDLAEMARHTFEDIDPGFVERVRPGDVVVAGANFGCGSSRETAVHVLRELGIGAVLARSFARIFFRNAINLGLPVVECDTTQMAADDDVEVDLERGEAIDHTRGVRVSGTALPAVMRAVLSAGGMQPYLREHGDLVLPEEATTGAQSGGAG
jgi:3-isopropylmalate/(R)-2-methylmalate dehydratase small subunit